MQQASTHPPATLMRSRDVLVPPRSVRCAVARALHGDADAVRSAAVAMDLDAAGFGVRGLVGDDDLAACIGHGRAGPPRKLGDAAGTAGLVHGRAISLGGVRVTTLVVAACRAGSGAGATAPVAGGAAEAAISGLSQPKGATPIQRACRCSAKPAHRAMPITAAARSRGQPTAFRTIPIARSRRRQMM